MGDPNPPRILNRSESPRGMGMPEQTAPREPRPQRPSPPQRPAETKGHPSTVPRQPHRAPQTSASGAHVENGRSTSSATRRPSKAAAPTRSSSSFAQTATSLPARKGGFTPSTPSTGPILSAGVAIRRPMAHLTSSPPARPHQHLTWPTASQGAPPAKRRSNDPYERRVALRATGRGAQPLLQDDGRSFNSRPSRVPQGGHPRGAHCRITALCVVECARSKTLHRRTARRRRLRCNHCRHKSAGLK